ncbi:MAG: NosD domain-containing protein, partial [Rhodothermales bacterium]
MTTWTRIAMIAALTLLPTGALKGQTVVTVSPDGPISTIEEAVRTAEDGARIIVEAGRYRVTTVEIRKPVTISGEPGAVLVAVDGNQIFTVLADGVTIEGLTLRGISTSFIDDRAAIRIERSAGCRIANNFIDDAFFGIYLAKANDCVIAANVFTARKPTQTTSGNGIHLWYSEDIDIRDNRIRGHRDGIYLEFSSNVVVTNNEARRNRRYGLHFMFSDNCRYLDNTFAENDAGVAVMYSRDVEMMRNRFVD